VTAESEALTSKHRFQVQLALCDEEALDRVIQEKGESLDDTEYIGPLWDMKPKSQTIYKLKFRKDKAEKQEEDDEVDEEIE